MNKDIQDGKSMKRDILLLLLNIIFISFSVNAPNLMVGYGLVIPAMMISLLYTRPLRGTAIFFLGHLIATLILIYTSSMFTMITSLSLIVRTLILVVLAYNIEKGRLENKLLTLALITILDTFISYSIALPYFGHDAIEVGLDIYSAVYIPYVYLGYKYLKKGDNTGSAILLLSMLLYYISAAYFYALPLNILSIATLIYFASRPPKNTKTTLIGILIAAIVLTPLSTPQITYNTYITTYPYHPSSWTNTQWQQTKTGPNCRQGNVLKDVYDPSRLRVLDTCLTIRGRVVSEITVSSDGDTTFELEPDPRYTYMLSIGSIILRKGNIHIEIVPADKDTVVIPEKGDYIEVTGVWVVDTDHGSYSEIHPAWKIVILESS
jgi:hypothetical protein